MPRDLSRLAQGPVAPLAPSGLAARGIRREERSTLASEPPLAPEESWSALVLRIAVRGADALSR
jgi:hypothetical protein